MKSQQQSTLKPAPPTPPLLFQSHTFCKSLSENEWESRPRGGCRVGEGTRWGTKTGVCGNADSRLSAVCLVSCHDWLCRPEFHLSQPPLAPACFSGTALYPAVTSRDKSKVKEVSDYLKKNKNLNIFACRHSMSLHLKCCGKCDNWDIPVSRLDLAPSLHYKLCRQMSVSEFNMRAANTTHQDNFIKM